MLKSVDESLGGLRRQSPTVAAPEHQGWRAHMLKYALGVAALVQLGGDEALVVTAHHVRMISFAPDKLRRHLGRIIDHRLQHTLGIIGIIDGKVGWVA